MDDQDRPAMSAPQLTDVFLGDPADSWRRCGFRVEDSGSLRLGSTTLHCTGAGGGFRGWAFDGLDPATGTAGATAAGATTADTTTASATIDGLAVVAPSETSPRMATHPNGITTIDHIVVRTGNCARTIAAFESAGFEVRGGRSTTSYGSPMRQTFLWAGDVILELIGPDRDEPTTEEPTSIFGFALVAPDLRASKASLGELLGDPKPAVQQGREIAGLRSRNEGITLPIAVMSPHVTTRRPESED